LEYNEEDDKNSDILIINEAQEGIKVFNDNDFFLKEPGHIFSIETGHRVLLELCYQSTITDYGAETEVQKVIDGFTKYSTAQNEYLYRLNSSESVFSLEETYRAEEAMNSAYKEYILILEGELEE
jgi:hypothetical protein